MAAVEAAAAVIRQLGTPIGGQRRLLVEGVGAKPRQSPRTLDAGGGEMLRRPKRGPRDAGIEQRNF